MKEITLPAKDERIGELNAILEDFLCENDFPMKDILQIQLIIEEVFVNICHYAYQEKMELSEEEKLVWIEYGFEDGKFVLTLKDRGIPFDPLAKKDPDVTLSAEERQIGGLGIFLTKKIMDRVEYTFKDGFNILYLEKNK